MADTKLPPHSLDSEEAVIGSLLIDGPAIEQVRYFLKGEHFYYAQNQYLYNACLALAERHQAIDQVTVAEELNRQGKLEQCGGVANLSRLISICPTSQDIENYGRIVRRLSVMRELIRAGERIAEIGYQSGPDGNHAIEQAAKVITDCQREHIEVADVIPPKQVGQEILDLVGRYNNGHIAMTYGFGILDKATTGLYGGELAIFGARTGVGKTQVMLDCSENIAVARPDTVQLFVSAEMSMHMIEERKVARALHIPVRDLRTHGYTENLDGKLAAYAGKVSEGHIHYLPRGISSVDISQAARRMKTTTGINIIWVDYLQRLSDSHATHRNETRDQAIGRVCCNLKQLAEDLQIPILVASQLSRNIEHRTGEDKFPRLSDLRDSGNIEQDADTVLLMHRLMATKPDTLYIAVLKHRQVGITEHPLELKWDYKTQRYVDGDRHG